jgi:hypothetical protein
VTDCELEELDTLWDEAKRVLKQAWVIPRNRCFIL